MRVAAKVTEPARTVANFGPVIVIRRGANELRYYVGAQLVRTFGVATGQSIYPTPVGTFTIDCPVAPQNRIVNPCSVSEL